MNDKNDLKVFVSFLRDLVKMYECFRTITLSQEYYMAVTSTVQKVYEKYGEYEDGDFYKEVCLAFVDMINAKVKRYKNEINN